MITSYLADDTIFLMWRRWRDPELLQIALEIKVLERPELRGLLARVIRFNRTEKYGSVVTASTRIEREPTL